jgi:hypothetical protein
MAIVRAFPDRKYRRTRSDWMYRVFCGIDPTAVAGWRNGKPCERFVI